MIPTKADNGKPFAQCCASSFADVHERRLLATGHFSDLTITCKGYNFRVHKTVLIEQGGDFFQRAICSGLSETHTSIIDFPEDDPKIIARVLLHICGFEFLSNCAAIDLKLEPEDSLAQSYNLRLNLVKTHLKMFAAAVKFGIDNLRDKARKYFVLSFNTRIRTNLIDLCDISYDFESIVSAVYSTTPSDARELRDLCLLELLFERDNASPDSRLIDMLVRLSQAIPDLTVDLAIHIQVEQPRI